MRRRLVRHGRRTERRVDRTSFNVPTPAEDRTSFGHDIERAVALDDLERMVIAEHEHERGEADSFSDRGEISRWAADPNTSAAGQPHCPP